MKKENMETNKAEKVISNALSDFTASFKQIIQLSIDSANDRAKVE